MLKNQKNAMETYRAKLKAQEEKELQIELSKIPSIPNFDTYSDEQLMAYINSNKIMPKSEIAYNADKNLRIRDDKYSFKKIVFEQLCESGCISDNSWRMEGYTEYSCISGNCKSFATKYKQAIDNSAFKDMIHNALPKPKNQ